MQGRTKWIFVGLILSALLLLAACSNNQAVSTTETGDSANQQSATDEHMDDADDHMDEDHPDDEHSDDGDHADDDHANGDEHDDAGEHEHLDVPEDYEGMTNPYEGDADAIAAGAELFATNCATCHGETGEGDGPAAAGLDPKPATLSDPDMMANMTDAYIFWRITEGGVEEPFNSAMPAWGPSFTTDQIWQLVSFLRTLAE